MALVSDSSPSVVAVGENDDDDCTKWEYEYDETETENFYLTLDLPTPLTRSRKKQPTSASGKATTPAAATTNGVTDPRTHDSPVFESESESSFSVESDPEDRLQILDLHTENPIISFQDRFYSCHWASTVGTDLFLASTKDSIPCAPLQSHQGFNLLGTSGLKIIGQLVQVIPRYNVRVNKAAKKPKLVPVMPTEKPTTTQPENEANAHQVVHIPIGVEAGRMKNNQARFIERLMASKSKRGETDEVTVHSLSVNAPSGWRSSRNEDGLEEQDEAQVEGMEEDSEEEQSVQEMQPQAAKRRRTRYRGTRRPGGIRRPRVTGGLFRDFRPTGDEAEGPEIRGISDSTPRTWDELREVGVGVLKATGFTNEQPDVHRVHDMDSA